MIQDSEVSRNDLILQDRSGRNVDAISVIGDDNNGALKGKK